MSYVILKAIYRYFFKFQFQLMLSLKLIILLSFANNSRHLKFEGQLMSLHIV